MKGFSCVDYFMELVFFLKAICISWERVHDCNWNFLENFLALFIKGMCWEGVSLCWYPVSAFIFKTWLNISKWNTLMHKIVLPLLCGRFWNRQNLGWTVGFSSPVLNLGRVLENQCTGLQPLGDHKLVLEGCQKVAVKSKPVVSCWEATTNNPLRTFQGKWIGNFPIFSHCGDLSSLPTLGFSFHRNFRALLTSVKRRLLVQMQIPGFPRGCPSCSWMSSMNRECNKFVLYLWLWSWALPNKILQRFQLFVWTHVLICRLWYKVEPCNSGCGREDVPQQALAALD